jgi:uncharacterized protein YkwD
VAVLAAVLLLPSGGAAAAATSGVATASAVTSTFKSSASQRVKRAARLTPVAAPAPAPALSVPTYSDRVLALTNAERTARGLRALVAAPCPDGYADSWAAHLAQVGSLSHQALSPILSACRASRVGENVAYGNHTPEQLVAAWMASTGHRANLLNAAFTHLGVGAVSTATGRVYGVQVFVTL